MPMTEAHSARVPRLDTLKLPRPPGLLHVVQRFIVARTVLLCNKHLQLSRWEKEQIWAGRMVEN
jgi:hypothetical protein